METESRNKTIIKYNIAGIVTNLALSVLKLIIGSITKSSAVMLDGINSFADMMSSFFSLVSTALGSRKADKAHPMGYGRLEYVSSFVITMIIIFVGLKSILSAIKSIIHPGEAPNYTIVVIVIMSVSFLAKLIYGLITRKKGASIDSVALIMAGTDSIGDAMIAVSILIAIGIYKIFGVNIENVLCLVISVLILKTGFEMVKECMTKMLGTRIEPEYRKKISNMIAMEDKVLNVSNLVMHNYGEGVYVGSLDIEVDEDLTAGEISKLSRKLIRKAKEYGLTLTSVGISGTNLKDPRAVEIWDTIIDRTRHNKSIIRAQSFIVDFDEKIISFYVVEDYADKNREEGRQKFYDEICETFPDMKIEMYTAIDM